MVYRSIGHPRWNELTNAPGLKRVLFPTSWPNPRPMHTMATTKHSTLLIVMMDKWLYLRCSEICTRSNKCSRMTLALIAWDFIMDHNLTPTQYLAPGDMIAVRVRVRLLAARAAYHMTSPDDIACASRYHHSTQEVDKEPGQQLCPPVFDVFSSSLLEHF